LKSKKFTLVSREVMCNCVDYIVHQEQDGKVEVIIRKAQTGKTLAQLGGLIGRWERYISENESISLAEVHDMLKAKFLARIYITEPLNELQEMWVDLVAIYQQTGQHDKLKIHAKKISLSWSTLAQVKQMMDDIEAHYQSIGRPLPVLDKDWKKWRNK